MILTLTFYAEIPRPVVIRTVTVSLAIGLVGLLLIGDEIVKGETIVCRDEVDRRGRAAEVEDVVRAREAFGDVGNPFAKSSSRIA
jgi:hypothetical protein